jgi:hypothetical protein
LEKGQSLNQSLSQTQAGAQSRKGGSTRQIKGFKDITKGEKVALGVGAAGSGALLGLKLKEDKGARAGGMKQGQSPKGGTAPKKKPKTSKKLPDARDAAKARPTVKKSKIVRDKKGKAVRDKKGKAVKYGKGTKAYERMMEKRKNR